jgi:hypothetical protein
MDGAPLLLIATQQKEDLCLEGIALPVAVEIRKEWILLEDLEQDFGVKCILKKAGKGRLSNSDDPFDG